MASYRDGTSGKTRRGLFGLLAIVTLLVMAVGLSGCVVAVNPPAYSDPAFRTVRAVQGVTAADLTPATQILDEYGIFYSTVRDDVVAIDQGGSDAAIPGAVIVTNPDVKQIRVILSRSVGVSEVGTFSIDVKGLNPGTTYYYRYYTIGHRSDGTQDRTLYTVGSHKTANPTLKSITTSRGRLSPSFSKTRLGYSVTLSSSTSSTKITVAPTLTSSKVQMKVGTGGYATTKTKTVSLSKGQTKTVTIKVTTTGGTSAWYTVKITRKS